MSFAMCLLRVRARQSASGPAGCDLRTTRNSSIGRPSGSVNRQIPHEAHLVGGLPAQFRALATHYAKRVAYCRPEIIIATIVLWLRTDLQHTP
ncbi:hypothetical protein [Streptomyces sp. NPDC058424]|uniref:hypothetical protein n=1 Tax=Streptomyces sp. NPDC058424 TaxID=3346491 RepID=UPI00364BFF0A